MRLKILSLAEEDAVIPLVAMLPDGFMEPAGELLLSFSSSPLTYSYSWDDESVVHGYEENVSTMKNLAPFAALAVYSY